MKRPESYKFSDLKSIMRDGKEKSKYTFFFYKQLVYKHTQPQIQEFLSTLLSTPPASDFEIDTKISEKMQFFSKNFKTKT